MERSIQSITLSSLPRSARVTLTLFYMLIGVGYIAAIGNLYHQHELADGREGLGLDDLRATFHGIEKAVGGDADGARSRMLEMIEPGGEMRKQLVEGGAESVRALESWLSRGAVEAEFDRKSLTAEGDPSAKGVIEQRCLRCHNADGGEMEDVPYGPDLFDAEYALVAVVAAPGTELGLREDGGNRSGPQPISRLFLVTHIHMLSIPVFTLLVSGAFMLSGLPPRMRGLLAPVPMLALVADFGSWWLARQAEGFVYVIATAGGVFGVSLGFQLVTVLISLWRVADGRSRTADR